MNIVKTNQEEAKNEILRGDCDKIRGTEDTSTKGRRGMRKCLGRKQVEGKSKGVAEARIREGVYRMRGSD